MPIVILAILLDNVCPICVICIYTSNASILEHAHRKETVVFINAQYADQSPMGRLVALLAKPFDPARRGSFPQIEAFVDYWRMKMEMCRKFYDKPNDDLYEDGYDHGVWKTQTEVMYSLLREGFSFEEVSRILHYTEEQSAELKPFALRFLAEQREKTE